MLFEKNVFKLTVSSSASDQHKTRSRKTNYDKQLKTKFNILHVVINAYTESVWSVIMGTPPPPHQIYIV